MTITKSERDALRTIEADASPGPWAPLGGGADHRLLAAARNALVPLLDALDEADRVAERAAALIEFYRPIDGAGCDVEAELLLAYDAAVREVGATKRRKGAKKA